MWKSILLTIATILIVYLKYIFSFWYRKGLPYVKPSIFFGNLQPVAKKQRSFGLVIYDLYKTTTEPFIGIYLFFRPALLVNDPEIVRRILVTDFDSFHDRGVYCNETKDPFSGTLFSLPGARWKAVRNQLSPSLTSGRIKGMFETILDVSDALIKYLTPLAEKRDVINIKDISARYTLTIITSVFFGIEADLINTPDHEFCRMMKRLLKPNFISSIRTALSILAPNVLKKFNIRPFDPVVQNFLINLTRTIIGNREKTQNVRKDFIQMLLQFRSSGEIVDDDNWEVQNDKPKTVAMSIEQCAGQIFTFYVAGSESSSGAISFCMHELTQNRHLLETLCNEVRSELAKNNNQITYESIKGYVFLDMCFKETLRKYPALAILNRVCTKDFEMHEKNLKITKGTSIIIPLLGLHRDGRYFSEPYKFNPYRFQPGAEDYDDRVYFPFGDGPHMCIGFRAAIIVFKVVMINMLKNFKFKAVAKTGELEYEVGTVPLVPRDGIKVEISINN